MIDFWRVLGGAPGIPSEFECIQLVDPGVPGESPLTLAGTPSPPQDDRFLSAPSDKSRVWKRYTANVRFVQ